VSGVQPPWVAIVIALYGAPVVSTGTSSRCVDDPRPMFPGSDPGAHGTRGAAGDSGGRRERISQRALRLETLVARPKIEESSSTSMPRRNGTRTSSTQSSWIADVGINRPAALTSATGSSGRVDAAVDPQDAVTCEEAPVNLQPCESKSRPPRSAPSGARAAAECGRA